MSSTLKVFALLFLIASLFQSSSADLFQLVELPITIPIGVNPLNACYRNSADSAPICNWDQIWTQLPLPFGNTPGAGDDVIIAPSTAITLQISDAVTINSLQVTQSATLNVSTGAVVTIAKNVSVSATSTLYVAGKLTVSQITQVSGRLTVVVGAVYTGAIDIAQDAILTVDDQTQAAASTSAQLVINANSYIRGTANFYANSFLSVTQSAALWANTAITTYGNVNVDTGASIVIVNTDGYTQENGTLTLNGYITADPVNNFGTLQGNGALNGTLYNSGTISPGNSPGTVVINGDYHQTDSGTYKFEIASANSYDRIIVTGTCYRAGILYANVINGYTPAPHQQFNVISHQHAQGTYHLTRGNINDATFTQFSTSYTDSQTTVLFSSAMSAFVISSLVFLPLLAILLM